MNPEPGPRGVPDRDEARAIVAAISEVMIGDASQAVRELVTGFEVLVERLMLARKFAEGTDSEVDEILSESVDRALQCVVAMQFYDRLEQRMRQMQRVAGCLAAGADEATWTELVGQLRSLYSLDGEGPLSGAIARFIEPGRTGPPSTAEVNIELF